MMKHRFALCNCVGTLVVCVALAVPGGVCAEVLDGVWRTDGYGYLLVIDGKHLRAFETTAVSCIPAWTAVRTDRKMDGVEAVFRQEMAPVDVLISAGPSPGSRYVGMLGDASRMVCRRLPRRPDLTTRPADTPQNNFKVFWTTYAEHYPFFALRGVNWKAVRDKYGPRIKSDMNPEELFALMKEMIEPLHDAHTFLRAPAINKRFRGERPDPSPLGPKDFERITAIIKKYLKGGGHTTANSRIRYGKLTDSVGYLGIEGFAGYTETFDFEAGTKALEAALDQALEDADQWHSLVIDVRVNGGGSDMYGVMVASRLASQEYLAFAKKTLMASGDPLVFTPLQETQVRPSRRAHFHGRVVLLTGRHSVSAAETFTMALMGRKPTVRRVGENTQGVFSDVLGRRLPNGWRFGLPNEIFVTESGKAFDGPGIPPDIKVPVFPKEDLEKGRDGGLEKALQLLMEK
jgi:hypothetical protein